jgi:hypothetical protein
METHQLAPQQGKNYYRNYHCKAYMLYACHDVDGVTALFSTPPLHVQILEPCSGRKLSAVRHPGSLSDMRPLGFHIYRI